MKYCEKFYEVARPLYDALQKACSEAYLYESRSSAYGNIPRIIYITEDAYTDLVIEEWDAVCEFFQVYDFEELCPWVLYCDEEALPEGVVKWEY